jgi:hypothetical protein
MRSAAPILITALLAACTQGPGRTPIFPDTGVEEDAGPRDATIFDSAPVDSGPDFDAGFQVTDTGPKMSYPFSGIFSILNASSPLYAREVEGRLNLVVTDFPYVYTGTIANDGTVDTTSESLMRSGCAVAKITGKYDRDGAQYVMTHRTCNLQGAPLVSTIMGGFSQNFEPSLSGIYELSITVMNNTNGCYAGQDGALVRYGFDFLPNNIVQIFTAEDVISTSAWYEGQAGGDGSFAATQMLATQDPNPVTSMGGAFSQATANDPLRFRGNRDIYDPLKMCGFSVLLSGMRIVAP